MKEIRLTQCKVALVDDENFEYLNQWNWHITKRKYSVYAIRRLKSIKKSKEVIYMHRLIMGTPKDREVDHIDHNGLNCQRSNMRNCTRGQNQSNRRYNNKTGFRGVHIGSKNSFTAKLEHDGNTYYLGSFKTISDAARAYDKKAVEIFGEYATLNF